MILYGPLFSSGVTPRGKTTSSSSSSPTRVNSDASPVGSLGPDSFCPSGLCSCGRRRFIEAAVTSSLFPICPSTSSASKSQFDDYTATLRKVHPPRPDWYEELYASALNTGMQSYEEEIAGYKSELFAKLKGKAEQVLEIGIGTGPNLRYYGADDGVRVFGVDPNKKMERYAKAAAVAAGLPLSNFEFIQAVGEAIPLDDASVDAVVGTLVLCSVKDVNKTLKEIKRVLRPGGLYLFVEHVAAKDGTALRFIQSVLDPLQQTLADGCHFTRETGTNISRSGFSGVELSMTSLSSTSIINPQIYGIACK
ncbi:putative phosphatidylethanolamine N-methyltransferase [Rosa chinensis]|uniref:Putative phosphatidylethanolamine N-methyltransferase n=1 Tax=Rosa chinensis TaxID=74649 RepID=A0A2P6R2V0_ROSCH|nr:methyltransferase-like protein 7A [Rosa chinensis]PRQ40756.1 putative phosphatidylethanolamine N-methyltransferase [Rosa chinensis]